MEYSDAKEYIEAFRRNPKLAVVSLQIAADFRGVSRAAIERMVAAKHLQEIKIKNTRCILAHGLIDLAEAFEHQVRVAREYLEEAAATRAIIFYEQVMKVLGMSRTVPADRTKIGAVLGRVSEVSFEKDGILLSAIVHRKTTGRTVPGPGFLNLAEQLDFDWNDERTFIEEQVKRVFDHYAGRPYKRGSTRKRS
jgi:hypothetical protein